MMEEDKGTKILSLYFIICLGFMIFLSVMFFTVINPRHLPSLYSQSSSKALRGSIISADGFHIATSQKLYKAVVNTKYIDPDKQNLFIEFSIYSGENINDINKKLNNKKGRVVLSFTIDQSQVENLKNLAYDLRQLGVFVPIENPNTGLKIVHGLDILASGETRRYPFWKSTYSYYWFYQ